MESKLAIHIYYIINKLSSNEEEKHIPTSWSRSAGVTAARARVTGAATRTARAACFPKNKFLITILQDQQMLSSFYTFNGSDIKFFFCKCNQCNYLIIKSDLYLRILSLAKPLKLQYLTD